jgi:hypothetical protein
MLFYGGYYIHGASCQWYAVNDLKEKFQSHVWVMNLPGGPNIGTWYRIKIGAMKGQLSFYIDDKMVLQMNDNLHQSGGVALYAHQAIVEFDNVEITGDGIPNMGFAVQPKSKLTATWGQLKR